LTLRHTEFNHATATCVQLVVQGSGSLGASKQQVLA